MLGVCSCSCVQSTNVPSVVCQRDGRTSPVAAWAAERHSPWLDPTHYPTLLRARACDAVWGTLSPRDCPLYSGLVRPLFNSPERSVETASDRGSGFAVANSPERGSSCEVRPSRQNATPVSTCLRTHRLRRFIVDQRCRESAENYFHSQYFGSGHQNEDALAQHLMSLCQTWGPEVLQPIVDAFYISTTTTASLGVDAKTGTLRCGKKPHDDVVPFIFLGARLFYFVWRVNMVCGTAGSKGKSPASSFFVRDGRDRNTLSNCASQQRPTSATRSLVLTGSTNSTSRYSASEQAPD